MCQFLNDLTYFNNIRSSLMRFLCLHRHLNLEAWGATHQIPEMLTFTINRRLHLRDRSFTSFSVMFLCHGEAKIETKQGGCGIPGIKNIRFFDMRPLISINCSNTQTHQMNIKTNVMSGWIHSSSYASIPFTPVAKRSSLLKRT